MRKKDEFKWMGILGICVLLGYFFTWKNIMLYQEKQKEFLQIKEELRLVIEKKEELEKEKSFLQKKQKKGSRNLQKEKPFSHLLEFELLLFQKLKEKNLELTYVSRTVFEGNQAKIPLEFYGESKNVFSFLAEMENYFKTISLSGQYIKIEKLSTEKMKVNCTFCIFLNEQEPKDKFFLIFNKNQRKKKKPYIKKKEIL